MREFEKETYAFFLAMLFLGVCIGIAIVGDNLSVDDISNFALAAVAIIGYYNYRSAIDYQNREHDKKELLRKIKELELCTDTLIKNSGWPMERFVQRYNSRKPFEDMEKRLIKSSISAIPETVKEIKNIQRQIEVEAASNILVSESDDFAQRIYNTIETSVSLTIILDAFSVNHIEVDLDEDAKSFAHYEKLQSLTQEAYTDYISATLSVAKYLGTLTLTLERAELSKQYSDKQNQRTRRGAKEGL